MLGQDCNRGPNSLVRANNSLAWLSSHTVSKGNTWQGSIASIPLQCKILLQCRMLSSCSSSPPCRCCLGDPARQLGSDWPWSPPPPQADFLWELVPAVCVGWDAKRDDICRCQKEHTEYFLAASSYYFEVICSLAVRSAGAVLLLSGRCSGKLSCPTDTSLLIHGISHSIFRNKTLRWPRPFGQVGLIWQNMPQCPSLRTFSHMSLIRLISDGLVDQQQIRL